MNIVGNTDIGGVHRLTSHALDYGNAWNDDTLLAHPDDQPLDQDLPVGKTNGFPCKPCCQFSSPWAGEVAIVVAPLDNGELFVPGLNAARELRDNISFNARSEEHTSELQSLMRISYAVFCLKKKKQKRIIKKAK